MKNFLLFAALASSLGDAKELEINAVKILQAPAWLKRSEVQAVAQRIERRLEWSTRQVRLTWLASQEELVRSFGKEAPEILAFTRKAEGSIFFGPRVTAENFSQVFGHELGHAIMAQKYRGAIPAWIEEGVVNNAAGVNQIDFAWLGTQEHLPLRSLGHPFDHPSQARARFHYMAASAVVKMLEAQCPSFRELLNLSLESKLDNYLKSYCHIDDLDRSFWQWVQSQARRGPGAS